MGKDKEEKRIKKVVLDTNVLISSLLFKGELAKIVDLWKQGEILPHISKETFGELRNVLGYPKFSLTEGEIKTLLEEEIIPFFDVVDITHEVKGICYDPQDDKFLSCAISASADFIVSGDKGLCKLKKYKSVKIITASEFVRMFK